jgi:hypothetical protein
MERESTFHDTVPLAREDLIKAREKAKKQKERILLFFRENADKRFTPISVANWVQYLYNEQILLTSVRRSITDLTHEGKLIKCSWDESRKGAYGKLNRTWRYNTDYVEPLNKVKNHGSRQKYY